MDRFGMNEFMFCREVRRLCRDFWKQQTSLLSDVLSNLFEKILTSNVL